MLITIFLVSIWALLMIRSAVAEYNYYQSVKTLAPEIWQQLGSPRHVQIPFVFVSPKGSELLRTISNKTVKQFADKHRKAGIQFLSYVVIVLVVSIVYFKFA